MCIIDYLVLEVYEYLVREVYDYLVLEVYDYLVLEVYDYLVLEVYDYMVLEVYDYLVREVYDDIFRRVIVRQKRQPDVAVMKEDQPRLGGRDQHVTADVELPALDQQRVGDVPAHTAQSD